MFGMHNLKKIKEGKIYPLYKNSFYIFMNTVFSNALGFVFWIIVAKYYSEAQIGLASTIISSMTFLAILGTLGFGFAMLRFLPSSNNKETIVNSFLTLSCLLTFILSIAYLAGLPVLAPKLLSFFKNSFYSMIFIIMCVVYLTTNLIDRIFISLRKAKYSLIRNFIFSILKIPLPLFLFVLEGFGIFLSWGLASLISLLIGFVVLIPKLIPEYRPRIEFDRKIIGPMLTFSLGNYISNIFLSAPGLLMPLMVVSVLSPEMAAFLYISLMVSNLLFMIPVSISTSFLVEVSTKEDTLEKNKKKTVLFTFLSLIPCIAIVFILADKILFLFGKQYSESATTLLRLLVISSIPFAVNRIYVAIKNFKKEVNKVVIVNGVYALGILACSYFLMKESGLVGVGIAWIIGNTLVLFVILLDIGWKKVAKQKVRYS